QQALAGLGQVADDFLGAGIDHGGTHRHRQDHILTLGARAIGTAAILAALGIEATGIAVIDQGIQVGIGLQEDGTTITAVTTIRTALGNELLPPETHAPIAAITGLYRDGYFIYEFHCAPPVRG